MIFKEGDLVKTIFWLWGDKTGRWWRVKFVDNNGTFTGKLTKKEIYDDEFPINHIQTLDCNDVIQIFKQGDQWCYKYKTKTCKCSGLCHEGY